MPRSQTVAGKLIDQAVDAGALTVFANNQAESLIIEDGRIKGVVTTRGTIMADYVVVCTGLWGRLIAEMAGEDLPVFPVDHPLTFFGPYTEFEGTGKDIGYPLLRDQGNSAYMRDTGDPKTTEGGQIEWGYYEEHAPRLVHPRDLLEKEFARLSPSQRDLEMEQIIAPLERAMTSVAPVLCAYKVGACKTVFDMSLTYARERTQFGQIIGRFARVQDHLIHLVNYLDSARWTTYEALWKLDTGMDAASSIHVAKSVSSESYMRACDYAHEVHAGMGVVREYGLTLHTKMSRSLYHCLGAPKLHRKKLEKVLGLV